MSDLPAAQPPTFSPKVMLALVLVGIFAFSGFAVLSAYAPDLRQGDDGQAHALSRSAIGFAGAVLLLKARETPVVISRAPPTGDPADGPLRVLTPGPEVPPGELTAFGHGARLLVVLPKWEAMPDPRHAGWVRKVGTMAATQAAAPAVAFDKSSKVAQRPSVGRPSLYPAGHPFAAGTFLPLDRIEHLQTLSGDRWRPVLVDEGGRMVLARLGDSPILVLADPDLLNTQGLKGLDNTRAALAILDALRGEDGVAFDVSLNGFKRPRSFLRLMFEPPLLGGTLCLAVAALLMGVHAAVRFGPPLAAGRAFALGKRALVDTSADLIRAARKEHELAPAYAALIALRTARAVGDRDGGPEDRARRLTRLEAHRRPADSLEDLATAAQSARTRGDTLSVAAKLFHWKSEMTRDRR